jgi:DNA-binding NtrC family response regulator
MAAILLIDDEDDVLSMMRDVLIEEGYAPETLSDGAEALAQLEARRFDVVVSDIMMPRLNGMRLLEAVKRTHAEVKVILVTGYATRELAAEALEKGASRLLEKPFTTEQFVSAVRDALGATPSRPS